jgi:hypothetical protein
MESLQIIPPAMNADASARLALSADYDSGWIAVTNHEGFVVELKHGLSGKPVQTSMLFSPDFVNSYSFSFTTGPARDDRGIEIDSDFKTITLVAKTADVLRCVRYLDGQDCQRWDFGFIRVLANL